MVEMVGAALAAAPAARLRPHPLLVQLAHYVVVGGLGTAVHAAVFLLLRTGLDAVPANLVALLVSTAVSTEANRRFTFGGGLVHRWRVRVQVGGTVLFYAFSSSAVLLLLELVADPPTAVQQTVAIAGAGVLGGLGRFLVLRYWVFGTDGEPVRREAPEPGRVDAWDERA